MRTFLTVLLCGMFVVSAATAQTGITVEPLAGLSFPTKDNFKDFYETGLHLGARAGYAITDNISVTVGLGYNRYSSKDRFDIEGAAAKGNGVNGVEGFDPDITFTIFGIKGGAQYGGTISETLGYFAGAELGPVNQKSSISDESEWDFGFGLYGGARYFFTPEAAVGFGPVFNLVTTDGDSYHYLDLVVSVAFTI